MRLKKKESKKLSSQEREGACGKPTGPSDLAPGEPIVTVDEGAIFGFWGQRQPSQMGPSLESSNTKRAFPQPLQPVEMLWIREVKMLAQGHTAEPGQKRQLPDSWLSNLSPVSCYLPTLHRSHPAGKRRVWCSICLASFPSADSPSFIHFLSALTVPCLRIQDD